MTDKKTIHLENFALDAKGNVKFLSFFDFLKKTDQDLINSFSAMGLSLLFGIVFLLFSLLAIKMTLALPIKIGYLILSFSLTVAGFSFFLYSLNEAFKHFKIKRQIKKGIAVESEIFQSLVRKEKERQNQEIHTKSREIQKHQTNIEELKTFSYENETEVSQKIINMK